MRFVVQVLVQRVLRQSPESSAFLTTTRRIDNSIAYRAPRASRVSTLSSILAFLKDTIVTFLSPIRVAVQSTARYACDCKNLQPGLDSQLSMEPLAIPPSSF
ncbi:hypothetical protein PM082_000275 [Marasmius tenuissimus]|nr:hypothetical protein PM082_000275 [Marasmius tenuissimus]